MVQRVVTVNDVLDGHVALDIECLDRIYLNAYVPVLQTSSQVVAFLTGHLGFAFPSPRCSRSSVTGSAGQWCRSRRLMTFRESDSVRTRRSWR